MKNLLFICSGNRSQSETAEAIWQSHDNFIVRALQQSHTGKRILSPEDIAWADVVIVLKDEHKKQLTDEYAWYLQDKEIVLLDIDSDYDFMDNKLVQILEDNVGQYMIA